mmetsp:Transcript_50156/g.126439  ORF Transcript_50156/g.126439 Transcript_50156/m.126439 type:complete len:233 (+) Transcript_50156:137-835(+)
MAAVATAVGAAAMAAVQGTGRGALTATATMATIAIGLAAARHHPCRRHLQPLGGSTGPTAHPRVSRLRLAAASRGAAGRSTGSNLCRCRGATRRRRRKRKNEPARPLRALPRAPKWRTGGRRFGTKVGRARCGRACPVVECGAGQDSLPHPACLLVAVAAREDQEALRVGRACLRLVTMGHPRAAAAVTAQERLAAATSDLKVGATPVATTAMTAAGARSPPMTCPSSWSPP